MINAAGVASLLFTTEACVVDAPEEKGPGGPPGMGGMGGSEFRNSLFFPPKKLSELTLALLFSTVGGGGGMF